MLFEWVATTLTVLGAFGYVIARFTWYGNLWWVGITTILFAFLLQIIVESYLYTIVCLTTKAHILPSEVFSTGIPSEHRSLLVYCVRSEEERSVKVAMNALAQSMAANQDPNMYFAYLSDTEDPNLVQLEVIAIRTLQDIHGRNRVIYFHRRKPWGKKWGAYQDLMVWLHKGAEHPITYTAEKYGRFRRDPTQRLFGLETIHFPVGTRLVKAKELTDGIVGDVRAIRCEDGNPQVKYLLVSDADVVWPERAAIKVVEKLAHADNTAYAILQPAIGVRNAKTNLYTRLRDWGRCIWEFSALGMWKVYETFPFYGKGAFRIADYFRTMMQEGAEVLPPTALSHDLIESKYLRTAYLPDIKLLEDEPTDYFEDLQRLLRWTIGDLICLWYEAIAPFFRRIYALVRPTQSTKTTPRPIPVSAQLAMRLMWRFQLSTAAFTLFLILTLLGAYLPGTYLPGEISVEIALVSFVLAGVVLVPRSLGLVSAHVHMGQPLRHSLSILTTALVELVLSTLIFLQQLVDRNVITIQALGTVLSIKLAGKVPRWRTSKVGFASLEGISLRMLYWKRAPVVALGMALPVVLYFTQPPAAVWYLSPVWLSFVLGPALEKLTASQRHGSRKGHVCE